MILTYKYRLLPRRKQHRALEAILEQQRKLYNDALEERIEAYRPHANSQSEYHWGTYTGKDGVEREGYIRKHLAHQDKKPPSINGITQSKSLTAIRGESPAFSLIQRRIQRETLNRLDRAYQAFYRRVKAGEAAGFPKFKGRDFFDGFGFDAFGQIKHTGKRLRFAGMPGGLRVHMDRPLPSAPRFTIKPGARAFQAGDSFSIEIDEKGNIVTKAGSQNCGSGSVKLGDPSFRGELESGTFRLIAREEGTVDKTKIVFDVLTPKGVKIGVASPNTVWDVIKNIWFKREGRIWYCGFQVEREIDPSPKRRKAIGVDWGTSVLAALSNGELIANPRHGRALDDEYVEAQQAVSRRKKGSKRRLKARLRLQKIARKTENRRKNTLNKLTKRLATQFKFVATEEFSVKAMMNSGKDAASKSKTAWKNRETLDSAPYLFRQMIAYKTKLYGSEHGLGGAKSDVDIRSSTDVCSECWATVKKDPLENFHSCPLCGYSAHKKVNAARVILIRAQNRGGPVPGDGKECNCIPQALVNATRKREARRPRKGASSIISANGQAVASARSRKQRE